MNIKNRKQEVKSKRLFYAVMGFLGLLGVLVLVLTYWTFERGPVLEIKNNPVPVRPTKIADDEYILLHYNYCKHSDAEGTVEGHLVSKTSVIPLPPTTDTTKANCRQFDAPNPIPGQAPPETYHYHYKACYPLNPIKESCTEWRSKEFTIEGPKIERNIQIPR